MTSRPRRRSIVPAVAAAFACGFVALPASADDTSTAALPATTATASEPPADPRALELKSRGDDAMDASNYADALAAYNDAYTIAPQPSLLYNIGRAQERLGMYPEALRNVEQFARTASPDLKAKVPHLNELLAELRSHVAFVTLHCNVDGVKVMLRGHYVASTPARWAITTTAGKALFEAYADGYAPWQHDVALEEGKTTNVDITLTPRDRAGGSLVASRLATGAGAKTTHASLAATSGPLASRDTKSSDTSGGITTKWWFWTGIGVGVVGGVALTAALLSEKSAPHGDIAPGQTAAPLVRW